MCALLSAKAAFADKITSESDVDIMKPTLRKTGMHTVSSTDEIGNGHTATGIVAAAVNPSLGSHTDDFGGNTAHTFSDETRPSVEMMQGGGQGQGYGFGKDTLSNPLLSTSFLHFDHDGSSESSSSDDHAKPRFIPNPNPNPNPNSKGGGGRRQISVAAADQVEWIGAHYNENKCKDVRLNWDDTANPNPNPNPNPNAGIILKQLIIYCRYYFYLEFMINFDFIRLHKIRFADIISCFMHILLIVYLIFLTENRAGSEEASWFNVGWLLQVYFWLLAGAEYAAFGSRGFLNLAWEFAALNLLNVVTFVLMFCIRAGNGFGNAPFVLYVIAQVSNVFV
jgi:hypothetical protein